MITHCHLSVQQSRGSYMATRSFTPSASGGSSRPVNYTPTLNITINGADPQTVKKEIVDALNQRDREMLQLINMGARP